MTHDELKERLKGLHLTRSDLSDPYLLELLDRLDEPKNKLLDGVAKLVDGGASLKDALDTLDSRGAELNAAVGQIGLPPELAASLAAYAGGVSAGAEGAGTLLEGLEELRDKSEEMADDLFGYEIPNPVSFLKAENNPRIAASADDVHINQIGGLIAGIIALMLFSYVISVFIVGNVDRDSEVIGTLYSVGLSRGELLSHYLVLPVVIAALGGICGTILGFSPLGVGYQMVDTASYFSYPDPDPYYPLYLLVYGLIVPPLIAAVVNLLVIRGRLSRPPLALLRREQGALRGGQMSLQRLGFINLFRIRQILRERRASMVVAGGMFITLLLLILGLNCYSFIATMQRENAEDLRFEYMLGLKFPPEDIPEGTSAAYLKTLSREIYGYDLEINLLGLSAGNPYFPFTPVEGTERLTISSSMANKYGLKAGDEVILTDAVENRRYAFMDIDSLRDLFDIQEDAYNLIFAAQMPDIEPGRIHSITTRADILKYADIYMKLLSPMIIMFVLVSTAVLVIVLYLMMKMMIDRASFGISLMKIFGFDDREVRGLYLDGNLITVAVSAVVGVPLAKLVMDAIYPALISNVALGPEMAMPAWIYAAIFGLIFLSYFVISALLNRKLKRVAFAEVLKRRD